MLSPPRCGVGIFCGSGGGIQPDASSVRIYGANSQMTKSTMRPRIEQVIPRDDYTLLVTFEDGKEGTLDTKPFLDFGVFRKLKDFDEFKRVRIASDAIEWECGVGPIQNMCAENMRKR